MLIEENRFACNGTGMYVGRVLTDLLLRWGSSVTVELASQIVAYAIKVAKDHAQYVGKGSDVQILPASGLAYSLIKSERKIVEDHFDDFFDALRDVVTGVDSEWISDERLTASFASLRAAIDKLRVARTARVERRARQKAYRPKSSPSARSPTDGQSDPQPRRG